MTADSDTIIMQGEIIIWRADADWTHAARPPSRILAWLRVVMLAAFALFGAAYLLHISDETTPHSYMRALASIAWFPALVVVILLTASAVKRGFEMFKPRPARGPASYVLTDRRLILTGASVVARSIMSDAFLYRADLIQNGAVEDLQLWFSPQPFDDCTDDDAPITLHALSDGEAAKKAILTRFTQGYEAAALTLEDEG